MTERMKKLMEAAGLKPMFVKDLEHGQFYLMGGRDRSDQRTMQLFMASRHDSEVSPIDVMLKGRVITDTLLQNCRAVDHSIYTKVIALPIDKKGEKQMTVKLQEDEGLMVRIKDPTDNKNKVIMFESMEHLNNKLNAPPEEIYIIRKVDFESISEIGNSSHNRMTIIMEDPRNKPAPVPEALNCGHAKEQAFHKPQKINDNSGQYICSECFEEDAKRVRVSLGL